MASGSALTSRSTPSSSPAAVIITCLQEMQGRLRRVEAKQVQIQAAVEEVKELVKANEESTFKVKGSPFQVGYVALSMLIHSR